MKDSALPEAKSFPKAAQELWNSRECTPGGCAYFFRRAAKEMPPGSEERVLCDRLAADVVKPTHHTEKQENVYGRRFDSEMVKDLIRNPPESAIVALTAIGRALFEPVADLPSQTSPSIAQARLADLAKTFNRDPRPWFSEVPAMKAFIKDPTECNLRQLLTGARTGLEVSAIPYVAVKMGLGNGLGHLGDDNSSALHESSEFYQNVILPQRSTVFSKEDSTSDIVHNHKLSTGAQGIGLIHHPGYDRLGDHHGVDKTVLKQPGLPTDAERESWRGGHSVVCGLSGTTNIVLHLAREVAKTDPRCSDEAATLGALMFVVNDGGHSAQEVMAVYTTLKAHTGALHSEDIPALSERIGTYLLDYSDIVALGKTPQDNAVLSAAIDHAFDRTGEYFRELHSQPEPLQRPESPEPTGADAWAEHREHLARSRAPRGVNLPDPWAEHREHLQSLNLPDPR